MPKPRNQDRHTTKITPVRFDEDLLKELDAWITGQEVPPSRTAAINAAVRQFLQKKRVRVK